MRLSDFDYYLPKELIAQYPLKARDKARLMVVDRATGMIEHRIFKDITGYLDPHDLLVLNNTRVLNCRLNGNRITGGKAEVFLLRKKQRLTFLALLKPGRLKINEKILFAHSRIFAQVTGNNEVRFHAKNSAAVYRLGVVPLPPYIKRKPQPLDEVYYQTVYAKAGGSVASPTAGLHFTDGLLARIKALGAGVSYVTLHVGLATFKPVTADDITKHAMGEEYFSIPQATQSRINAARAKGGRIIAVGTTSCRTLETYASGKTRGYTDLFIYPGYRFTMTDCLLTNFHLPRTTLFMLVCAFCGGHLAKKAYAEAVKKAYRFYSYGDAMLII